MRQRRDFSLLAKACSRFTGQWTIVEYRKGKEPGPRIGITVSKKYGHSVERNRFKRIVREAFRLLQHNFPHDIEINVKPLPTAHLASSRNIQNDFANFLATVLKGQ